MAGQPNLYSFPDTAKLARDFRKYIVRAQHYGLVQHSSFRVAVSGGSLPKILAKALLTPAEAEDEEPIIFPRWEIFFADERAVPLDHEDSNYKVLKDELLDKIPEHMGKPKVHLIKTDLLDDVQELADQYEKSLIDVFVKGDTVKVPIFDLLLLGCGPDGHTCSLFPKHELLSETIGWVLPIEDSPKPPPKRITLSMPVVHAAVRIAFVATGEGKQNILKNIFDTSEGKSLPCGIVNEHAGDKVSWFTDQAATGGVAFPAKDSVGDLWSQL
ncbi:MAG: suppressor of los1-1 [Chrysothrix sp. TS-e1954]|nr:MAG: suppressor of los1-1 [Chrysothrix sp. TS-e1954]